MLSAWSDEIAYGMVGVRHDMAKDLKSLLRSRFADHEWDWLQDEPAFISAIEHLESLSDVRKASTAGASLLTQAAHGDHPQKRPPPIRPPRKR